MNITAGDVIIYSANFITLYLVILWLVVFWQNKNNIYKPKLKKNFPSVSIIVPCFNEERTIIKTVRSLLDLDYPKNKLEIIVIDDGSKDRTYQRAEKLLKHKQVKLFHKENGGKWTALNYGIEKSNSEFIGCLDADSFVASDALKLIIPYFKDKNVMAVTSSLKVFQPRNTLQQIQWVEYIVTIIQRKILSCLNSITVTPGPFSIYRKKIFEKIGPFAHGHNTEDCEMALRIQSKNWRIANAADACVYTVTPASLKALQKQRKRWYQGFIKNAWDYRYMFMNKKYKDLGLFVLPITPLSILALIIMMLWLSFTFIQNIINQFIVWQSIGFNFHQINFNWFFVQTSTSMFLGLFLFALAIIIFFLGKEISNEKFIFKKGLLFFFFLYPPLFLFWWLEAIQAVFLKKENKW